MRDGQKLSDFIIVMQSLLLSLSSSFLYDVGQGHWLISACVTCVRVFTAHFGQRGNPCQPSLEKADKNKYLYSIGNNREREPVA